MGECGGLGGGDDGLVSESAGHTATGDVGTVCAGTEPGRELGAEEPAEVFEDRRTRKSLFATSRKRDMDSSSNAWRSSGSLLRSTERRLLTLGGTTVGGGAMVGTSRGSICGKVMSGRLAGAGEPMGEPREEAGGVALGADSKGSTSLSVARATCLTAARRRALVASMSLGGGGAGQPLVAKRAAQHLRVELGDGGIELDGSRQERQEDSVRRKGILGPRRGPRRSTTTSRGHSAV